MVPIYDPWICKTNLLTYKTVHMNPDHKKEASSGAPQPTNSVASQINTNKIPPDTVVGVGLTIGVSFQSELD